MDALNIADGSVVAEIGAGGRVVHDSPCAARRAERARLRGRHPADDDRRDRAPRSSAKNLRNVRTVLGGETNPNLPGGIDAVLIADTYREIEDPMMRC